MAIFKNDEEKIYMNTLNKFRKKHIPERYNQVQLLDHLLDPDIDHLFSISNRADGKSHNYLHTLTHLSYELDLRFILLCRHYTVRMGLQNTYDRILDKSKAYRTKDFMYVRTDFYTTIHYKDKTIGMITDLNQATDLKYQSNFLEDFPIIIYDEFLALEGDYLIDEYEKLKTIYASVNRKDESDIPFIKIPKIIYLGNPVNFSSPILANLEMFNILEKHKINTVNKYENIMLEMYKNENANEERNLRAFDESRDDMTHGEFTVNNFNIATDYERGVVNKNKSVIYVKLLNEYLRISYNPDNYIIILGIVSYCEQYDFNMRLKDNTSYSEYLKEGYFDNDHIRKYNKGIYKFDNNYSRDLITDGYSDYRYLDIMKIIRRFNVLNMDLSNFDKKEKQYEENYIERTKKNLVKKFLA